MRKIKQQSAIKRFLMQEFGEQKGLLYFGEQESVLEDMLNQLPGVCGMTLVWNMAALSYVRCFATWMM